MAKPKYIIPVAALVVWVLSLTLLSRFYIGVNPSSVSCLNVWALMVDKHDQDIQRGDIAAFEFDRDLRHLKRGDKIAKLVAGVPGDHIQISANALRVNGEMFRRTVSMTPMLQFFGQTMAEYQNEYILGPNEYFMVGETKESFDSRYWGPIKHKQIVGQAYAIF